jgi:hypothetical protein
MRQAAQDTGYISDKAMWGVRLEGWRVMASGQEQAGKGHNSVQQAAQDTGCASDGVMCGATTEALSGELVEMVRQ